MFSNLIVQLFNLSMEQKLTSYTNRRKLLGLYNSGVMNIQDYFIENLN